MSVEVTRLAHRFDGRHRQHAASADGVARRLGRLRQPRRGAERARHFAPARAHGVQGHQASHRAPDRRGDRAGRRRSQRGNELRDHGLFRQRAQDRHAACGRRAVRHPGQSDLRSGRAQARAERHRAGNRRVGGQPRRSGIRLSAIDGVSEPADRPRDPGHAGKPCAPSGTRTCAPISPATIAGPTWCSRRPAPSSTAPWLPRWSGASTSSTARPRRCHCPASFRGGTRLEARDLEQVHIALALEGLSQKHADYFSLQVFTIVLGGGMSSRLFQEVREKRGLCYTISAFHAPYSDTGMFGIYAGTDAGDVQGVDAGRRGRDRRRRGQHYRGRGQPCQGADQGRPA